MKSLLLVVCAFLVMSSAAFAGDWFELVPSVSDTVQLYSNGKDTTVMINILRKDMAFTGTIGLSYTFEYSTSKDSWTPCEKQQTTNSCNKVKITPTSVNPPYKPIGITITPKSSTDTLGFYRVRIKAEYGSQNSVCVLYFRVLPASMDSRFYVLKGGYYADMESLIISYDTSILSPITADPNSRFEIILGQGKTLRKIFYTNSGMAHGISVDYKKNFWWTRPFALSKYGPIFTTIYSSANSEYSTISTNATDNHFGHLSDGTTYTGNSEGLFRIGHDGVLSRYPTDDKVLSKMYINAMCDFKDTVWISLSPNHSQGNTIQPTFAKLSGNSIYKLPLHLKDTNKRVRRIRKMKHDKEGNIYGIGDVYDIRDSQTTIFEKFMLVKFTGEYWNTFPMLDSTGPDYKGKLIDYVFDNKGKMWIITNKHNLLEFNGTQIGRVIEGKDSPLENVIENFMQIDSMNTIYLSTRGPALLFNPDGIPLPSIAATAVEEEPVAEALTGVYPQPAREYVTFELPSESEFNPTTIELLNSAGMSAMPPVTIGAQASGRYTLPTSELPSGLYFVVLHSGKMLVKKPVVVVR